MACRVDRSCTRRGRSGSPGEVARKHATQRLVLLTPSSRHEKLSPAFTGYLVKPLRAASLAARLALTPEVTSPDLAPEPPVEPAETAAAPMKGLSILWRKTTRSTRS